MSGLAVPGVRQPERVDDELDAYMLVRFQEAREAGLTRLEAARFAHGTVPLRTLRKLRAGGCGGALIARIVT